MSPRLGDRCGASSGRGSRHSGAGLAMSDTQHVVNEHNDSGVSQLQNGGCNMATTAAPATATGQREPASATDALCVQPLGRQQHRQLVAGWLSRIGFMPETIAEVMPKLCDLGIDELQDLADLVDDAEYAAALKVAWRRKIVAGLAKHPPEAWAMQWEAGAQPAAEPATAAPATAAAEAGAAAAAEAEARAAEDAGAEAAPAPAQAQTAEEARVDTDDRQAKRYPFSPDGDVRGDPQEGQQGVEGKE